MTRPKFPTRLLASICTLAGASLIAAGCGSDDSTTDASADAAPGEDLTAVKDYLTEHADNLQQQVGTLAANAEEYYALAEAADFDYDALMEESCEEVGALLSESQDVFVEANPAYEEMEGIVAGVPRLAQYDVDIDAGADASDPGERGLVQPRAARRRVDEAARQPVLPDRDGAVRDQPGSAGGRQAGRRLRRQGRRSARASPTPTPTSRPCASSSARPIRCRPMPPPSSRRPRTR